MVGSASEEKMLEERHRKKQLEKQATQPDEPLDTIGTRDSRFDDFGDDFDYDAMMDDDGLEERIPGVNADADEDDDYLYTEHPAKYDDNGFDAIGNHTVPIVVEDDDPDGLDPDNDQENFAGFVFQRSNPASSLVSPSGTGMTATPRDALGRVIGFAMTDETSPGLLSPAAAAEPSPPCAQDDADIEAMPTKSSEDDLPVTTTGLGIDHLTPVDQQSQKQQRPLGRQDDLYFDQGLADELDFGDMKNTPRHLTSPSLTITIQTNMDDLSRVPLLRHRHSGQWRQQSRRLRRNETRICPGSLYWLSLQLAHH